MGDFNIALNTNECWGSGRKSDPLADRLRTEFLMKNLIDVPPKKMAPTWDNRRSGPGYIAKRLDRFIIKASLIAQWGMPEASTGDDFTSDHRPIFLKWRILGHKLGYAFKFNRIFLKDASFTSLIKQRWDELKQSERTAFTTFREKMQSLRKSTKDWIIKKKKSDKKALQDIMTEISIISGSASYDSMPFDLKVHLHSLEKLKQALLLKEESAWRLKSRALWIKEGDHNTKFFHNFANARRNRNSIWKIEAESGGFVYSQHDIEREATIFFQKQYRRRPSELHDVLWMIDRIPVMFDEAANEEFFKAITESEILEVIKKFQKDKSPGPDGWPIEFFQHFFDLFKHDLLGMVDATRMSGHINSALTATFIALIPKKEQSDSFADYRPIALCNILFKVISKIIAERLKPILNSFINRDQYAFLKHRNILDAVALAQESLFSVSTKNSDAAVFKIDLAKAFDCVDWGFLRILLAKIGLKSQAINWVMACVENVQYSVIINGTPLPPFRAERGLRQGCPLSPLLFILVMDTLSTQINHAVAEHRCVPLKICKNIYLSHNLFVDDILIFAMLCKSSWLCISGIFQKLQSAVGLVINTTKSTLYHNDTNVGLAQWIADLFGVQMASIQGGFKYLGFFLKPKAYSIQDWAWLVDRFYQKISRWELRFLSLAGRLILVQSVLSQLAVYWAHLFSLPAAIIRKLSALSANFLWGGRSHYSKLHLANLDLISKPKKSGGWGLLHQRSFGRALLCISLSQMAFLLRIKHLHRH